MLCFDCRHCDHCIACTQLQHQSYCILNQPVSEQEFERVRTSITQSRKAFDDLSAAFYALKYSTPHRSSLQINCINSTGNDLYNCKNASICFNCRNVEDSKYMFDLGNDRDSMDCYEHGWLVQSELIYESHAGMASYHLLFCHLCANSRDLLYCDTCPQHNSNLFGCISMKQAKYCILNKQYTKEEYEDLVPKIIARMREDGEWGEFFPVAMSTFAYNATTAQEYFPLTKEEALKRGWKWQDQTDEMPKVDRVIPATQLPDSIDDIPDDILNWAITCEATKRPFKIIKQELEFYRNMRLPVPHFHPDERHRRRMALRNPRKLWNRECAKCKKPISTSYAPERPEIVYCEECYLREVY